jgi:pimeloyl-ACP methyl ester carboxylesterase
MQEWWIKEMGKTPQQTMEGVFRYVATMDITALLPHITPPTLIITSDRSALASVETVREWQMQIPNARLLVLPSNAYHLAAAHPEECAMATLRFIENLSK